MSDIDFSKVVDWELFIENQHEHKKVLQSIYETAVDYLMFFDWCENIKHAYVGMIYAEKLAIFLFNISKTRNDVDDWVWVIVGDIPPAYITCEDAPNPASALDAYVGAMHEWVKAAKDSTSVAQLIPVNVPATPENAVNLEARLKLIDEKILSLYVDDLSA